MENATNADAGAYECVASNSVGSDSYMVIVHILSIKGKGVRFFSPGEKNHTCTSVILKTATCYLPHFA